jgi:hypothetical protein
VKQDSGGTAKTASALLRRRLNLQIETLQASADAENAGLNVTLIF